MVEYQSMNPEKRREVMEKIKKILIKRGDFRFACVYGSFLNSPTFRDIDIGVYAKNVEESGVFDYELGLEKEIAAAVTLPLEIIEVKILNSAPLSFLGNIFREAKFLFAEDQKFLTNMIERVSLEALANEHIARQSLAELIPA